MKSRSGMITAWEWIGAVLISAPPKDSFKLANIITAPAGGFIARAATAAFSFSDGDFEGVIQALQEQGDVQVVSQPMIRTGHETPLFMGCLRRRRHLKPTIYPTVFNEVTLLP